jgi:hypothetical protein
MTIKDLAAVIGAEIFGGDPERIIECVAGPQGPTEQSDRHYVAYWPGWMNSGLALQAVHCAALVVPKRWARERWAMVEEKNLRQDVMRNVAFLGVDVRPESVDADIYAAQQRAAKALGSEAVEWRNPRQEEVPTAAAIDSQRNDRVARDIARQGLPTSTYALERLRVRETSRLATKREKNSPPRHVKTAWGEASVRGDLTEVHGLVLAAVMRGGRAQMLPGGQVEVEFTLGDICRALGAPKGKWPLAMLDDLLDARLDVRVNATGTRGELIEKGHILDRVTEERRPCPGASNLTGTLAGKHRRSKKSRIAPFTRVMRVRIGDLFLKLWREDYCVYESPEELATLYSMRRNVSRMVARFCKTHDADQSEGYTEDYLAGLADPENANRIARHTDTTTAKERNRDLARRRKLRHALHADAALLKALGLTLADGKVGFSTGEGE